MGVHMTKENYVRTITNMLEKINNEKQLERIYKLTKYIYLHKSNN